MLEVLIILNSFLLFLIVFILFSISFYKKRIIKQYKEFKLGIEKKIFSPKGKYVEWEKPQSSEEQAFEIVKDKIKDDKSF